MIADYNDDAKMAEAGRRSLKYKAINEHKEAIRTIAVAFQSVTDTEGANNLREALNGHIDALIEAMEL